MTKTLEIASSTCNFIADKILVAPEIERNLLQDLTPGGQKTEERARLIPPEEILSCSSPPGCPTLADRPAIV